MHDLYAQTLIQWDWQHNNQVSYTDLEFKNNTVYAVGNFTAATITLDSNTYVNAGGTDAIIAKMDTLGNIIWCKHIASSGNESLKNICIDNDDNVLAIGTMQGNLQIDALTLTCNGRNDAFIVKCSPSGSVLLAKNVGTIGNKSCQPSTILIEITGLEIGRQIHEVIHGWSSLFILYKLEPIS